MGRRTFVDIPRSFSSLCFFFSIGHQSRFQQQVLLEEEDITLTFTGYQYLKSWQYLYYAVCVLTGGIIFLLGRWMPQRLIAWIATPCEMSSAEAIVIEASMQFNPAKLPSVVPYLPPYFFFFWVVSPVTRSNGIVSYTCFECMGKRIIDI